MWRRRAVRRRGRRRSGRHGDAAAPVAVGRDLGQCRRRRRSAAAVPRWNRRGRTPVGGRRRRGRRLARPSRGRIPRRRGSDGTRRDGRARSVVTRRAGVSNGGARPPHSDGVNGRRRGGDPTARGGIRGTVGTGRVPPMGTDRCGSAHSPGPQIPGPLPALNPKPNHPTPTPAGAVTGAVGETASTGDEGDAPPITPRRPRRRSTRRRPRYPAARGGADTVPCRGGPARSRP